MSNNNWQVKIEGNFRVNRKMVQEYVAVLLDQAGVSASQGAVDMVTNTTIDLHEESGRELRARTVRNVAVKVIKSNFDL